MNEATITFRVDSGLKRAFSEQAKAHDMTPAQLFRRFMRDYIQPFRVAPSEADILSEQEAAAALNISLPCLQNLLDAGEIPSHLSGGQRRVLRADALHFKKRQDAQRAEALDALSAQAQALRMGYE
jgi:excisionase family DNA binding protein